jgi:hypothetical protein
VKRAPTPAPRRWLRLAQVADLMRIEHPSQHYRVQYVRRLVQRREQRAGTAYLIRLGRDTGRGRRGTWYVSQTALRLLIDQTTTTAGKLRQDVDELRDDHRDLRRQVNGHGARLRDLEKFRRATDAYVKALAEP